MQGRPSPGLSDILAFLFWALVLVPPPAHTSEWKGTREIRDGVVYVSNPAEPMNGTVEYELRELWRLESETADGEVVFGVVEDVAEDPEGNVYILDSQLKTVHVVSPEGQYLRSIGREGEGPGEFSNPVQLIYGPQAELRIVDLADARVVRLGLDGVPIQSSSLRIPEYPDSWPSRLLPHPSGSWVAKIRTRNRSETEITESDIICVVSNTGNVVAELTNRLVRHRVRGEPYVYDEESEEMIRLLGVTADGRILVSEDYAELSFSIFNVQGHLMQRISREGEPLQRSADRFSELENFWESYYSERRNVVVKISPFDRALDRASQRWDERFWVRTVSGMLNLPPNHAEIVDVYDQEGVFVEQAVLKHEFAEDEDLLFLLPDHVVIARGAYSASLVAAGAVRQSSDETEIRQPAVICCKALRVAQNSREPGRH